MIRKESNMDSLESDYAYFAYARLLDRLCAVCSSEAVILPLRCCGYFWIAHSQQTPTHHCTHGFIFIVVFIGKFMRFTIKIDEHTILCIEWMAWCECECVCRTPIVWNKRERRGRVWETHSHQANIHNHLIPSINRLQIVVHWISGWFQAEMPKNDYTYTNFIVF